MVMMPIPREIIPPSKARPQIQRRAPTPLLAMTVTARIPPPPVRAARRLPQETSRKGSDSGTLAASSIWRSWMVVLMLLPIMLLRSTASAVM